MEIQDVKSSEVRQLEAYLRFHLAEILEKLKIDGTGLDPRLEWTAEWGSAGEVLKKCLLRSREEITEALARMREGIYGNCLRCGNEIDLERLEDVPWEQFCTACQSQVEREHESAGNSGVAT